MDYFLSIVIPIYNGGKYLDQIISDIYNFNKDLCESLQIIIVNDGSTDDSIVTCKQIAKKNENIVFIDKPNGGIASARNEGLKHASGKYITFCDQDDRLKKGYSYFLNLMQEQSSDVLVTDVSDSINGVSHRIIADEICDKQKIDSLVRFLIGGRKFPIKYPLAQPINIPNTIWNCIFSKKLIDENHIVFEAFVDYDDDWKFCLECIYNANRVYLSKDNYYCWTINPNSESHSSKYIPDLYERRQRSVLWQNKILKSLNVSQNDIDKNNALQAKRSIIWGFYNACRTSYRNCKNETLSVVKKYRGRRLYNQCDSPVEKLYLFLLTNNLFEIAFLVNKYILKRVYH